jgi:cytochrome c-type biogenesis protein CcmH/NrfG
MNEQIVLIAIAVVAAAFILRPLLRGRAPVPDARRERDAAPAAAPPASDELAELELDREMGRVSESDYVKWRGEIEAATPAPAVPDATVVAPAVDAESRAEALVRRWRDAPRPECPHCGQRPEPGAKYCSNCGTSLAA